MATEPQEEQINLDLQAFQENPAAFMKRLPPKADEQGGGGLQLFDQAAVDRREYVEARDSLRQTTTETTDDDGRAAFASNDQADGFVDSFRYAGLEGMEGSGLMSASLSVRPWSGDYWAICRGILGKRYADSGFPNSSDWASNYGYIRRNPPSSTAVDDLSPSEKYDLLVGDSSFSLTERMWAEGEAYYRRSGTVPAWMGICHGWAPAAYMLPRPTGTAQVIAADGHTHITFYPDDIKGLASLLWAKCCPKTRFIGGRCNDSSPSIDPENGRILSQKCFDTNPGTWHLAAVNQIGYAKRSMVMDATYDYQVWNQPVVGYSYRYFNPQSMRYAGSLAGATVSRAAFTSDRFKKYRSSQTDSFVGIAMNVSYTVETSPSQSPSDSPADDSVKTVRYLYDLELDAADRIIGGEWYQNAHPDFLWTPPKGSRAQTSWEPGGTWQSGQPLPSSWRSAAVSASANASAPLAAVVERLIAFSNS